MPFGDDLTCTGPEAGNLNPLHFTGKERDAEDTLSGNDYFGARFYSSNSGRFMSPDYAAAGDDPDAVPYADFTNPQSLNLYSLVDNNPLTNTDPDGHDCWDSGATYSINGKGILVVNGNCDWGDYTLTSSDVSHVLDQAQNAVHQVVNYLEAPRTPGCGGSTAAGGALAGGGAGALYGLTGSATGPGVLVIDPVAILTGAVMGGASGWATGMSACMIGGGSGGGGRNRGSGGGDNQRANKAATDAKKEAERRTGKKFTRDQERYFHDQIGKHGGYDGFGYEHMVEIAVDILEGR